jgi:F-type H+-transporting ATPase subunit gamma
VAERKVELESRIESMSELEEIFGAMRGIAAARVQQGTTTLLAVRSFASTVYGALDRILTLRPASAGRDEEGRLASGAVVVVFTTEHGFVGGLNDNILREAGAAPRPNEVFVLGTRGWTTAAEVGLHATSIGPMSIHLAGIGEVADRTVDALLRRFKREGIGRIDVVSAHRLPSGQVMVDRRTILPVQPHPDLATTPAIEALPPITNLPRDNLLPRLVEEYLYARLVEIAAESLVAENAARLAVLESAHEHLDDMLESLRDADHRLRQDEITAEVLELVAGRSPSQTTRMLP